MKSAIILYDSKFGNTEKIVKALAEGMKEQGLRVDCTKIEDHDISKLNDYDLLAIGGPTHILGISKPMKNMLKKLEGVDLKGKKAFAFDTKLKGRFAGSAGKGTENRLKRLHMDIVKPYASAIVKGQKGPLEEGAEETFKMIGADLTKS